MCSNGYFRGDWQTRNTNRNCFLPTNFNTHIPKAQDCVVDSPLIGPADTSTNPLLVSKITDPKDDTLAQKRIVTTGELIFHYFIFNILRMYMENLFQPSFKAGEDKRTTKQRRNRNRNRKVAVQALFKLKVCQKKKTKLKKNPILKKKIQMQMNL